MTTKTAVKEKPILFSGAMVRAILDGTKTQTRRVVKPKPEFPNYIGVDKNRLYCDPRNHVFSDLTREQALIKNWCGQFEMVKCPYGQVGDRLWVRETFYNDCFDKTVHDKDALYFRADGELRTQFEDWIGAKWTPSIHMLRWASRINLEITSIRVERLQDISEEDALAEGILKNEFGYFWEGMKISKPQDVFSSPKYAFANLINFVNDGPQWNMPGKPKPTWDLNPWVWVVGFGKL